MLAILWAPASAGAQECAQPLSGGAGPTASDCLFILKVAVGTESCSPECVCAPSGTLPAKATDALLCLNAAVGSPVSLDCPCEPTTTSTTVSTTTTTITLPPGDIDNDGLGDEVDPCPEEALNRCAGVCANDETLGRPIRLNAVNPDDFEKTCRGQRVDCNGDVWEADFGNDNRQTAFQCDLGDAGCAIQGLEDIFGCRDENTADIFRCEHFESNVWGPFGYSFAVPNGTYLVNLLFGNVYSGTTKVGSRVFDVRIEGQVVLEDFDQVLAAGGSGRAVVRSVITEVNAGDGLQIEFVKKVQNPAIKGIEILRVN
jgi:hypothetical protein